MLLALRCLALCHNGLLCCTEGVGCPGVGFNLGEEVGPIFLFGDRAEALKLLFHGHGADGTGVLVNGFVHCLLSGRVLWHPQEVVVREKGAGT